MRMHTDEVGELRPDRDFDAIVREPTRRERTVRWASEHKLIVTAIAVLAFVASLLVAFELGHAYAEGARSLPAFAEHLGEMINTYVGAWLWRAPQAWLW